VNPARIPAGYSSPALDGVRERLAAVTTPGIAALERLMVAG
jgi:hypothetical protein